ncbi:MAG: GIY-YIG nuclease family protein [bacterium]
MTPWCVYLVRCRDGTLYTGIATDVSRRFAEHEQSRGKGAKYLRGRGPLQLVFRKEIGARGLALRVEGKIKRLSKVRKEELLRRGIIEPIIAQAMKGR